MEVAIWLGIVGSITGLTALGLQLWQFVLSGARIKLKASQGFKVPSGKQVLILQITNKGRIAATVQSVSVELSWDGLKIPLSSMNSSSYVGPNFPVRIEHLANESWYIPLEEILNAQTEEIRIHIVRGLATLSDDKTRRSRKFEIRQNATGGPIYSKAYLTTRAIWKWTIRNTRGHTWGTRE